MDKHINKGDRSLGIESTSQSQMDFYNSFWPEGFDFTRYHPGSRHRRRLIQKMLDKLQFKSVLDVGCGPGDLLVDILARREKSDLKLTGADISQEVVEKNSRQFPTMSFFHLDIQKHTISNVGSFDLIICSEVIEHLSDQRKAIENLASMLAKGGALLITCPSGKVFETEKSFGHTKHPSVKELTQLAIENGLGVEKAWNWGWPTYGLLKIATNINTSWALKNFASGHYSPVKKWISTFLYYINFFNINSPMGCQLFVLLRKPS
jgi:SAM-dependent methyltransferase